MSRRRFATTTLIAAAGALVAGVVVAPSANASTSDATTAPTVTVSDSAESVQRGETVRFEITVTNESSLQQSYAVGGILPEGFTAKAAALDAATDLVSPYYIPGAYIDAWVNLAPGQTKTIAFDAVVTAQAKTGDATTRAYAVSQQTSGAMLGFATPDIDTVR